MPLASKGRSGVLFAPNAGTNFNLQGLTVKLFEDGRLPLHRRILQPLAPSFEHRIPEPSRFRSGRRECRMISVDEDGFKELTREELLDLFRLDEEGDPPRISA